MVLMAKEQVGPTVRVIINLNEGSFDNNFQVDQQMVTIFKKDSAEVDF